MSVFAIPYLHSGDLRKQGTPSKLDSSLICVYLLRPRTSVLSLLTLIALACPGLASYGIVCSIGIGRRTERQYVSVINMSAF